MGLSWNYGGIFVGIDATPLYATQIQSLGRIFVLPRPCCCIRFLLVAAWWVNQVSICGSWFKCALTMKKP